MSSIVLFLQDAMKGIKSYGPRSLISVDDVNILTGTLSLIRGIYRKADIHVIANFDINKITTKPYKHFNIIRAKSYKETLLEIAQKEQHVIFINHDTVFNGYLLNSIPRDRSSLVFDNRPISRGELCGLTQDNQVLRLAYGLDDKHKNVHTFSHIYGFHGTERHLLVDLLDDPKYKNFDIFELANEIIDQEGSFEVAFTKKSKAIEIKCPADIKIVGRMMR